MTQGIVRKEFDFSPENISLVKTLLAQGLSYKQVARKLSKDFCTKRKHKNITNRTIANLLQDVKRSIKPIEHYSDSDIVHNRSETTNNKTLENKLSHEPIKSNETDLLEIMSSNLSEAMKLRCIKLILD